MGTKKIIALGLITASVLAVVVKQKINKVNQQFDRLKLMPTGLQNLKVVWNDFKPLVTFTIDLQITNPLKEPFEINGIVAKLQRIIIYDKNGRLLGVSTPNVGNIKIPALGAFTLSKIPFTLDVQTLAINLINYKSLTKDSFIFEGIITVLGAEYKIQ